MRVTTKGQVTIPQHVREKLGIIPAAETIVRAFRPPGLKVVFALPS